MISADGRALSGPKTVDELSITGAPILVAKQAGSPVFAGTILGNGMLELTAEKTSEDTAFGKIVERVEEAQDSKAPTERFIDRFSKRYTPAVLAIAVLVWFVTRNTELVITILVLGCPGAFVIGVPVSNVASIGDGARHDILFKGERYGHEVQPGGYGALQQDGGADLWGVAVRAGAALRRQRGS